MKGIKTILKDQLLIANFISNFFYSVSCSIIQFILIKDVGSKIIALNSIIMCLTGALFPILWNKYSEKLYRKYGYLLGLEAIAYISIATLILTGTITNKAYYLLDTLLFALISKNIICGGNKLRAKRYNSEDKREKYDNNSTLIANLSSLIGFGISFIFTIPVNIAFILITIGICFDNIFYYKAYRESII